MSENKNMMRYGEYTAEAAEKELEEEKRRGGANRLPYVKFADGQTTLRILPPLPGKSSPFTKVAQHRLETDIFAEVASVDPDELRQARGERDYPIILVCSREHGGRDCPACEWAWPAYNEAKESKRKADQDRAYGAVAKTSFFCSVIVRGEESKGPQVWRMSRKLWEELQNMRKNPKIGNFTDPGAGGFDIIVTKRKTGPTIRDVAYAVTPSRMNEPLSEDAAQIDEWCTSQPDLSALQEVVDLKGAARRILDFGAREVNESVKAEKKPARRASRTAQDDIEDAEVVDG